MKKIAKILILALAFPSLAKAQIYCSSCSEVEGENWCIYPALLTPANPSFSVEISCDECEVSPKSITVSVDDTKRRIPIRQLTISTELQKIDIDLSNLFLSDGKIQIIFEVIEDNGSSISCAVVWDDYPKKISGLKAVALDQKILLSWTVYDRDITSFAVFYGKSPTCAGNTKTTRETQVELSPLENNVTWCGWVVAWDSGGKRSPESEKFYAVPGKALSFTSKELSQEELGCIITAIFGRSSKITLALRRVKNFLLELPGGERIVKAYYEFSRLVLKVLNFLFPQAFAFEVSGGIFGTRAEFERAGRVSGSSLFVQSYGKPILVGSRAGVGVKVLFLKLALGGEVMVAVAKGKRITLVRDKWTTTSEIFSEIFIVPVHAVAVGELSFFEEQIAVPYAVLGGGAILLRETNETGYSSFGGVWGYFFEIGAKLLLDVFDRYSERVAKREWGIKNTYLFAGWRSNFHRFLRKDSGFRPSSWYDLSSSSLVVGVSVEFN